MYAPKVSKPHSLWNCFARTSSSCEPSCARPESIPSSCWTIRVTVLSMEQESELALARSSNENCTSTLWTIAAGWTGLVNEKTLRLGFDETRDLLEGHPRVIKRGQIVTSSPFESFRVIETTLFTLQAEPFFDFFGKVKIASVVVFDYLGLDR